MPHVNPEQYRTVPKFPTTSRLIFTRVISVNGDNKSLNQPLQQPLDDEKQSRADRQRQDYISQSNVSRQQRVVDDGICVNCSTKPTIP